MEIRRATGADVGGIRRVAERSWEADYPSFLTRETITSGVEEWYNPDSIRADLGNPLTVLLVAVEDETVVGFAQGHREEDVGHLLRIYVDPDHRRSGVATALFDATCETFRSAGVERIRAMALAANDPGRAFYRSLGMDQVDTGTTTIDGDRYDEAIFERRATEP